MNIVALTEGLILVLPYFTTSVRTDHSRVNFDSAPKK
jgi:hypothetical protein